MVNDMLDFMDRGIQYKSCDMLQCTKCWLGRTWNIVCSSQCWANQHLNNYSEKDLIKLEMV